MPLPLVGKTIPTWFSGNASGRSRIIDVRPYTGKYVTMFTHILVLTAPNTKIGQLEMAVHESDILLEIAD